MKNRNYGELIMQGRLDEIQITNNAAYNFKNQC